MNNDNDQPNALLLQKAYQKIKNANNILLVTHHKPDGDALSSMCLLISLLNDWDKNFFAYCADTPPLQFNFLPHLEKISSDKSKLDFSKHDLIISLDCGSLERTMLFDEIKGRKKTQIYIEFDHHPKIDDYGNIEIRFPAATSTAEILYDFLKINKIKIDKNVANCILTGILTDTNNFLYPSTSDKSIKIGSEMLTCGARFPLIINNTYRNKSLPAMKAWGKAINNLKINKKYNFAVSALNLKDFEDNGATEEEMEGIAGFLSNLSEVKGLLWLREEKNKIIKGSLRTSDPYLDISLLARALGGGGHAKASGFIIEGKLEETKNGWRVV
ncbi:MAG: bifunctional oligoribonuclease/PAP phosphatase NrnA [bacterium]